VDLDRDILARMAFAPLVRDPKPMDAGLFRPEPMSIRGELVDLPLGARFVYDPAQDTLFIGPAAGGPVCLRPGPGHPVH